MIRMRFPKQIHDNNIAVADQTAPAKHIGEAGDLRKMDRNAVSRVSHLGHAISATHGRSSWNAFTRQGGGAGWGELDWVWIGRIRDAFRQWALVLPPADMHQAVLSKIREASIDGWGELGMAVVLTLLLELTDTGTDTGFGTDTVSFPDNDADTGPGIDFDTDTDSGSGPDIDTGSATDDGYDLAINAGTDANSGTSSLAMIMALGKVLTPTNCNALVRPSALPYVAFGHLLLRLFLALISVSMLRSKIMHTFTAVTYENRIFPVYSELF